MASNLTLKLGSRHLYTALSVGFHPGDELAAGATPVYQAGTRRVGWGLGVGYRFDLEVGRLRFLELEAHSLGIHPAVEWDEGDDVPRLAALRAVLGVRLAGRFTLIAGLTGNVAIGLQGRDLDIGHGVLERVARSGSATVRIFPGLLVGVQI